MNKTLFITGAAGFIGHETVVEGVKAGWRSRGLFMLLDATADAMGVKRPGSAPTWLAALVAGSISVETITLDVHADNAAMLETGFEFRYPSYREGVPATLQSLGYGAANASAAASTEKHARTGR